MWDLNRVKRVFLITLVILLLAVPYECFAEDKEQITVGITYTGNCAKYVTSVEKSGAAAYSLPLVTTKKEAKKTIIKNS